jgi:hypothetical protein
VRTEFRCVARAPARVIFHQAWPWVESWCMTARRVAPVSQTGTWHRAWEQPAAAPPVPCGSRREHATKWPPPAKTLFRCYLLRCAGTNSTFHGRSGDLADLKSLVKRSFHLPLVNRSLSWVTRPTESPPPNFSLRLYSVVTRPIRTYTTLVCDYNVQPPPSTQVSIHVQWPSHISTTQVSIHVQWP